MDDATRDPSLPADLEGRQGRALRSPQDELVFFFGCVDAPGSLGGAHPDACGAREYRRRQGAVQLARLPHRSYLALRLHHGARGRHPKDSVQVEPRKSEQVHHHGCVEVQPPPELLRRNHHVGGSSRHGYARGAAELTFVFRMGFPCLHDAAPSQGERGSDGREAGKKKWGSDPEYIHYITNTSCVVPWFPAKTRESVGSQSGDTPLTQDAR